jgi:hypothetical protein
MWLGLDHRDAICPTNSLELSNKQQRECKIMERHFPGGWYRTSSFLRTNPWHRTQPYNNKINIIM